MDEQTVNEQDKSQLQQEFDRLTEKKKAEWAKIKHLNKGNYEHEQAPEWQEIQSLDEQLIRLHNQIKGGE